VVAVMTMVAQEKAKPHLARPRQVVFQWQLDDLSGIGFDKSRGN